MTKRIAAIWFPDWVIECYAQPQNPETGFVVTQPLKGGDYIIAANDAAGACGIGAGQRLVDGLALDPKLQVESFDPLRTEKKLLLAARWAGRYSPWVGLGWRVQQQDHAYGLLLDITGCAHLFGGERALIRDLIDRFARRGICARGSVAGTIGAAWALAHFSQMEITILPNGQEVDALSALPVEALRIDPKNAELCRRFGLRKISSLLPIARPSLTQRFGEDIVLRMDQAFGMAGENIVPILPPPEFHVHKNLAVPQTDLPSIQQEIDRLTQVLSAQLKRQGRGARRIDLRLMRTDRATLGLAVPMSQPIQNAGHIRRLLEDRLEQVKSGFDAAFGVDEISLTALRTAPVYVEQLGLYQSADRSSRGATSKLHEVSEKTLQAFAGVRDRIINRLGSKSLVRLVPHASHIPEQAVRYIPALSAAEQQAMSGRALAHAVFTEHDRPLILFPTPEQVEVIAEIPEGAPRRFRWRKQLHDIVEARGPERIGSAWWQAAYGNKTGLTRDYFRLEDSNGYRFWIYRDGLYGQDLPRTNLPRWYLHGLFA
jgi:protein ImuB